MNKSLAWQQDDVKEIADCSVFTVNRSRSSIVRDGKRLSHDFFYLHCRNWVNVIPMTSNGEVILIEQFRAGIKAVTLEIPGGTIDETDESSKTACTRELLEETGYAAQEVVFLGRNNPNPAIQDNYCDTYLATNVEQVMQPKFQGTEEISVNKVPLIEIPSLIRTGSITHALVIVAFHYLHLHEAASKF